MLWTLDSSDKISLFNLSEHCLSTERTIPSKSRCMLSHDLRLMSLNSCIIITRSPCQHEHFKRISHDSIAGGAMLQPCSC